MYRIPRCNPYCLGSKAKPGAEWPHKKDHPAESRAGRFLYRAYPTRSRPHQADPMADATTDGDRAPRLPDLD